MTIKELAKLADVSIATVSKIMNNKDENISPVTREKVLRIAQQHNYSPYAKAISKAFPKTQLVGVVVPDISDRLYASVVQYLDGYAMEQGYSLVVTSTFGDVNREALSIDSLLGKRVEYILFLYGRIEAASQDKLREHNTPFYCVPFGPDEQDEDKPVLDFQSAAEEAVSFLSGLGFEKMAAVLREKDGPLCRTLHRSMERNKIVFDESLIFEFGQQEPSEVLEILAKTGVKAVVVQDTEIARLIYSCAYARHMNIPGDLSVISFDFGGEGHTFLPELCTLVLPHKELAKILWDTVFHMVSTRREQGIELVGLMFKEGKSTARSTDRHKVKICVIGGVNLDVTFLVDEILGSTETMTIHERSILPGGKAGNQAIGVARLDGAASIISILSNDMDGKNLYNNLAANNVDVSGIGFDNAASTGIAYIFVTKSAEYLIGYYQGTSDSISRKHVEECMDILLSSEYCLLQNSIPDETLLFITRLCRKHGIRIILKPSGYKMLPPEVLEELYMLVPNKTELNQIMPGEGSVGEKAAALIAGGARYVVVTLGEEGCYFTDGKAGKEYPAIDVEPIDTTGASDAFISALAVLLAEGESIDTAIEYATIAAGISTTRLGAQSSLPDRYTLEMYRKKLIGRIS